MARTSPRSLYRPDLASFDMTGYDPTHAEGFIRLFGLPVRVAAQAEAAPAPGGRDGDLSSPRPPAGAAPRSRPASLEVDRVG